MNILRSFVAGLAGAAVILLLWIGYQDHRALQDVIAFLQKVNTQAQAGGTP